MSSVRACFHSAFQPFRSETRMTVEKIFAVIQSVTRHNSRWYEGSGSRLLRQFDPHFLWQTRSALGWDWLTSKSLLQAPFPLPLEGRWEAPFGRIHLFSFSERQQRQQEGLAAAASPLCLQLREDAGIACGGEAIVWTSNSLCQVRPSCLFALLN